MTVTMLQLNFSPTGTAQMNYCAVCCGRTWPPEAPQVCHLSSLASNKYRFWQRGITYPVTAIWVQQDAEQAHYAQQCMQGTRKKLLLSWLPGVSGELTPVGEQPDRVALHTTHGKRYPTEGKLAAEAQQSCRSKMVSSAFRTSIWYIKLW